MKYCSECNKKYPDADVFCDNCGNKLTKYEEETEKIRTKKQVIKIDEKLIKFAGAIGVLFIALFLFSFIGPKIQITGASTGIVTTTVCRDVEEPYEIQESYQTPISYSVVDASIIEGLSLQLGAYSTYTIKIANSDDVSGTFNVKFILTTNKPRTLTQEKSQYIYAHNTGIIEAIFDTDIGEKVTGSYDITPPTKTAYRTVTKYRTVQKCY